MNRLKNIVQLLLNDLLNARFLLVWFWLSNREVKTCFILGILIFLRCNIFALFRTLSSCMCTIITVVVLDPTSNNRLWPVQGSDFQGEFKREYTGNARILLRKQTNIRTFNPQEVKVDFIICRNLYALPTDLTTFNIAFS